MFLLRLAVAPVSLAALCARETEGGYCEGSYAYCGHHLQGTSGAFRWLRQHLRVHGVLGRNIR